MFNIYQDRFGTAYYRPKAGDRKRKKYDKVNKVKDLKVKDLKVEKKEKFNRNKSFGNQRYLK